MPIMYRALLLSVAILGISSPSFAQSVPTFATGVVNIGSNVACRNKARSKYFELGATSMSDSNSNSQWATINGMRTSVWCRETQAFITVAGFDTNAIVELRDEIQKAY